MKKAHLKNTLLRICTQPRSLEYISKKMGGLDPVKISDLLEELKDEKKLTLKEDYWSIIVEDNSLFPALLNDDSGLPLKKYMGHFDFLKIPHPLDFEWRNTLKSLNFLAELIGEVNSAKDKVLILGMPTLFATCSLRNLTQSITLIERNGPIVRALEKFNGTHNRVLQKDIFKADPNNIGRFYSVFMDPPWYSNYLYQFVWLGAQCLVPGGVMVISIPPINTRDGIDKERIEWFSYCQNQGLCIEKLEPEMLEYAMPFFEFNAFRAKGITNVLPFWRKGDLVFFRKVSESKLSRPALDMTSQNWIEKEINSVRIRVNLDSSDYNDDPISIKSLIKADILPSVSRSCGLRKKANVWTSGNRIFQVNKANAFWKELESKNNMLINDWVEMIVEIEKKEYKDYLAHIYYEMERQTN